MTAPSPPCCPCDQWRLPTAAVSGFGGGLASVIGILTFWAWPAEALHPRLLVLAVFVGVFAAKVTDRTAIVVTTVAAGLVFVVLTGTAGVGVVPMGEVWGYWIPIGMAAVIGRGQWWLRHMPDTAERDEPEEPPR